MTSDDQIHLQDFLTTFGATRLGEGDPVAGANLLAAMACSLANVARPGSGLVAADESTFRVGTSLLVSGSQSTSLVSDTVVAGLGGRQNSFNSHLRNLVRDVEKEARKEGFKSRVLPTGPRPDYAESALAALQNPEPILMDTTTATWAKIVRKPARPRFRDLVDCPLVFLTGSRPPDLDGQLGRCHLGRPVLHAGMDRAEDFRRFGDLCPAVMDGRASAGPMAGSIRGTVILTDPLALLGDTLRSGDRDCAWLGRLLWLVDGGEGPGPPGEPREKGPVEINRLNPRFETAMDTAWAKRLDNHEAGPVVYEYEFAAPQARWVAFLGEKEEEFPGITGAARSLFATLVFGFHEMIRAERLPEGFKWYVPQVEVFARFLVLRMANARAAMLRSAGDARRRRLQSRILHKLAGGPLDLRGIYRGPRGLTADLCRELLTELLSSGRVVSSNGLWSLPDPPQPLTLDV